jgi:hypothetical protein
MKFDKDNDCETCKYGYFVGFTADGCHNLCGKYNCYLCVMTYRHECDDYEKGDVPEDIGERNLY